MKINFTSWTNATAQALQNPIINHITDENPTLFEIFTDFSYKVGKFLDGFTMTDDEYISVTSQLLIIYENHTAITDVGITEILYLVMLLTEIRVQLFIADDTKKSKKSLK